MIPDYDCDPASAYFRCAACPAEPVITALPGHEALLPAPDEIFPAGHAEPFEHEAPVLWFPVLHERPLDPLLPPFGHMYRFERERV